MFVSSKTIREILCQRIDELVKNNELGKIEDIYSDRFYNECLSDDDKEEVWRYARDAEGAITQKVGLGKMTPMEFSDYDKSSGLIYDRYLRYLKYRLFYLDPKKAYELAKEVLSDILNNKFFTKNNRQHHYDDRFFELLIVYYEIKNNIPHSQHFTEYLTPETEQYIVEKYDSLQIPDFIQRNMDKSEGGIESRLWRIEEDIRELYLDDVFTEDEFHILRHIIFDKIFKDTK